MGEMGNLKRIRDVMTGRPVMLDASAPLVEAARSMRDRDIGDVLVMRAGRICGIVTDRDIVVRALADGRDPRQTTVGEVCSQKLVTVAPDDPVDQAVQLMRDNAVRRLPVVENGAPVGIVSLGDLAVERDPRSVLGEVSAAQPNN